MTKTGSGTLLLTDTNSYTGGTTIVGGVLEAVNLDSLPGYTSSDITLAAGAVLAVSTANWSNNDIADLVANWSFGSSVLGIDVPQNGVVYSSVIGGDLGIAKLGEGNLTLNAANTYAGGTTVIAGVLLLGDDDCLPTSGAITAAGGVLNLAGYSQTTSGAVSLQGGEIANNNYLTAIKQFTRWLVRDRRTPSDPLVHLSRLNVRTDRRHDRRALTREEFARLIDAARGGKRVEGLSGPDRALLYVLAAWTGFRKGEIGSLTLRSLKLDEEPPTATVAACYSKHRRQDTQVLHPEVVRQLKEWLARKGRLGPEEPLFPISGRVPGGTQRKTSKMMERDLMAARDKWLDEAKEDPEELKRRLESDFLCHCNHDGLYADFHSLRHCFVTGLAKAGVSPKMAQTLARHGDIRLTLGVYTHVELPDRSAAIGSLPAPPSCCTSQGHPNV